MNGSLVELTSRFPQRFQVNKLCWNGKLDVNPRENEVDLR